MQEFFDKYDITNKDLYNLYFGKERQFRNKRENYVDMVGDIHFFHGAYETISLQLSFNKNPTYVYSIAKKEKFSTIKFLNNSFDIKGKLIFFFFLVV